MKVNKRERKSDNVIKILKKCLNEKETIPNVIIKVGFSKDYVRKAIARYRNLTDPTTKELEAIKLYDKYLDDPDRYVIIDQSTKNKKRISKLPTTTKPIDFDELTLEEKEMVNYDAYSDENYDERSFGESLRENEAETFTDNQTGKQVTKITRYHYCIKIKGEEDLTGYLTRDEMNMVYRLYSNLDGAGLTIRAVSRHFSSLTYRDFKRILRAFNITKQSIPVAPHILEEESESKILDLIFRNKENNILKKLEIERGKHVEVILKETQRELVELKDKKKWIEEALTNLDISEITPFKIKKKNITNEKALMVYISDQHVGADNSGSLYGNKYNADVFKERMENIVNEINTQAEIFGRFDRIIVCNLGDSLDGYNAQTTRGGHSLPQNMNNKEQFNVYVNVMLGFFDEIHNLDICNHVDYYSVGDDNHSGDFGYIANKTLELVLGVKYPDMNCKVFEKFISHIKYGDHTFILTHGKDKEDKKFGFPLILDNKTELYFNEYIDNFRIRTPHIHVVKGDLHQSATQYSKRFRYKNVGSQFGSSKWIHSNFGQTASAIDYEIVDKDEERIWTNRITFSSTEEA
jgi:hypothetical protein